MFFIITANGLVLGEVVDFKAQKFSLAQKFNRNPNVQFSTSAQIAQNPCYAFGRLFENEI